MRLPHANKATVSKKKILDYILSETHPVGRSKAKFFRGLGFNEANTEQLAESLLKIAKTNEVKSSKELVYGTNYAVEGTIKTPSGKTVTITTIWFIRKKTQRPSFVTAYPVQ